MARDYWFAFSAKPSDAASLAPTFITFLNSSGATIAPPAVAETYAGSGLYKVNYNATQTIAFVLDGATTGLATAQRYISGVFDNQDQFGQTMSGMAATLLAMGTSLSVMGGSLNVMGGSLSILGGSLSIMGGSLSVLGGSLNIMGASMSTGFAASATLIANQGQTLLGTGATLTGLAGLLGTTSSSFGTTVSPTTVFGFLKRCQEYNEGNRSYTKATGILDYYSRGSSTLLIEKTISDNSTGTTCI